MRVGTGVKLLTSFASEGATGWATNLHLEAAQWAKSGPQFVYIWISCQKWNLPPPEAPSASSSPPSLPPSPLWVQKNNLFPPPKNLLIACPAQEKIWGSERKKQKLNIGTEANTRLLFVLRQEWLRLWSAWKSVFLFFFPQRLQRDLYLTCALQKISKTLNKQMFFM